MPQISTPFSSRLFYRKVGNGPVVMLMHGFPENGEVWNGIWEHLADKYTVIMPDFPGVGQSPLDKETSITDMADCVHAILEHEQVPGAVLAGHSMGGYVSLAFAQKYADKVAGLSLVHSSPEADNEEKKTMRRKVIDIIGRGGKKAFIEQMVYNLFAAPFAETRAEVVQRQVRRGVEVADESLVNFYNAMLGRESSVPHLPGFGFPVQWIIGDQDNVIPFTSSLRYCYGSAINFVSVYKGCGHMSMFEEPAALCRDLKKFAGYCYGNQAV